jgi:hypothetical protein
MFAIWDAIVFFLYWRDVRNGVDFNGIDARLPHRNHAAVRGEAKFSLR